MEMMLGVQKYRRKVEKARWLLHKMTASNHRAVKDLLVNCIGSQIKRYLNLDIVVMSMDSLSDFSSLGFAIIKLYSETESHSVVSDSLWCHELYSPWNSPGQNTGVGSLSLLQEIFPTQGLNPGLPHCRQILYQLSHKGSPSSCVSFK